MGSPAALVAQQGLSPMGIAATVTHAPSDADDLLDVQWTSPRDGEDGEEVVRERDLRWVSTSRLPAVGDDALLFVDSQGDPWAFVRSTGAQLATSASDVTAAIAAVINTGGLSIGIRFGVATLTWPGGGGFSNPLVIPHGLGRTPVTALITGSQNSAGIFAFPSVSAFTLTTTTFSAQAGTVDGTNPPVGATTVIYWLVIG